MEVFKHTPTGTDEMSKYMQILRQIEDRVDESLQKHRVEIEKAEFPSPCSFLRTKKLLVGGAEAIFEVY